jgi:ABC-type amino acid transport system permease subunit
MFQDVELEYWLISAGQQIIIIFKNFCVCTTLFCWYHSVIPKKPKRFQKCQNDDVTRQNTSKTMTKHQNVCKMQGYGHAFMSCN